jgi:hypothetical protein
MALVSATGQMTNKSLVCLSTTNFIVLTSLLVHSYISSSNKSDRVTVERWKRKSSRRLRRTTLKLPLEVNDFGQELLT